MKSHHMSLPLLTTPTDQCSKVSQNLSCSLLPGTVPSRQYQRKQIECEIVKRDGESYAIFIIIITIVLMVASSLLNVFLSRVISATLIIMCME